MKYLITSDIHGSIGALDRILRHFQADQFDMLVLLGDLLNYGPRNSVPADLDPQAIAGRLNALKDRIVAVRGNCDSEVDQMLFEFPILSDYALIVDEGKRLFLTHGHIYNKECLPPMGSIDCFFYGHTHLPHLTPATQQAPLLCNTGSPTFPKGGNPPTFAIYENGAPRLCRLDGTAF